MSGARMSLVDVRKGDVVRFRAYALRVEAEPKRIGNTVILEGRRSDGGCPYVRQRYILPVFAEVERP